MSESLIRAWERLTPTFMLRAIFSVAAVMFVLWLLWVVYFVFAYWLLP